MYHLTSFSSIPLVIACFNVSLGATKAAFGYSFNILEASFSSAMGVRRVHRFSELKTESARGHPMIGVELKLLRCFIT